MLYKVQMYVQNVVQFGENEKEGKGGKGGGGAGLLGPKLNPKLYSIDFKWAGSLWLLIHLQ